MENSKIRERCSIISIGTVVKKRGKVWENWTRNEKGEKSAVIAMTSLEIPNTCFIFLRHSIPSPSPTRSKNVEFVFHEAIKRPCPWIHTYAFRAFR